MGLAVFNLAAELRGSPRKPTAGGESRRLAAVAAASLAFLRNRVSSPRDMSAAAAVAFRSAADRLIGRLYYP